MAFVGSPSLQIARLSVSCFQAVSSHLICLSSCTAVTFYPFSTSPFAQWDVLHAFVHRHIWITFHGPPRNTTLKLLLRTLQRRFRNRRKYETLTVMLLEATAAGDTAMTASFPARAQTTNHMRPARPIPAALTSPGASLTHRPTIFLSVLQECSCPLRKCHASDTFLELRIDFVDAFDIRRVHGTRSRRRNVV